MTHPPQGVDAVMLSAESAAGGYPREVRAWCACVRAYLGRNDASFVSGSGVSATTYESNRRGMPPS